MTRNKWLILLFVLQIFSFLLIPFFEFSRLFSLLATLVISLFVILISDSWMKYFYPIFAMSCYIIIMRLLWLIDLLEIKELVFASSWIGCSLWCIISAIKIALK